MVHLGFANDLDPVIATNNMKQNIIKVLDYATYECPLILETGCGEGSELCADIDDLISFYNSFTPDQKQKIAICVDTCHVFAAGYNPLSALIRLKQQTRLVLIHYNDSETPKGSHTDRHASPGHGYLGSTLMTLIYQFAIHNNIDIVTE